MSAAVAISSITIGDRHRRRMGDLRALANSIAEVGLLQPIGVTSRGAWCSASAASVPVATCWAGPRSPPVS